MNIAKEIIIMTVLLIGFIMCIIPYLPSVKNLLNKTQRRQRQDLDKWKDRQRIQYAQRRHSRLSR